MIDQAAAYFSRAVQAGGAQQQRSWLLNIAKCVWAARLLLPHMAQDAAAQDATVAALADARHVGLLFWPHIAACWRLTPQQWEQAPAPCHGLEAALPVVVQRSEQEARCLVQHLPDADRARLRTFALVLVRLARTTEPPLPALVVRRILSMFDVPDRQRRLSRVDLM
jgi:hypothetical protein